MLDLDFAGLEFEDVHIENCQKGLEGLFFPYERFKTRSVATCSHARDQEGRVSV